MSSPSPAIAAQRPSVALVTGVGRGLGEAIARALAEYGHLVVVTDAHERRAASVARSLGTDSAVLDVTDESQWKQVVSATARRHGGLDVLVNNAGIGYAAALEGTPQARWDQGWPRT